MADEVLQMTDGYLLPMDLSQLDKEVAGFF